MEEIFCCPACSSVEIKRFRNYQTLSGGTRIMYNCLVCNKKFSETSSTPMYQVNTEISKIASCIKLRSEGLGQRATARVLGIHKNTVKAWEERFASIKETLKLYLFCHEFVKLTFEGDEVHTRVKMNKPAHESEGWTAILMERGSRYILESKCGPKEEELFKSVLEDLAELAEKTEDLALFTDGERRYSKILFDLCNEKVRTGGRMKKVLSEGIRVRLKNKGGKKAQKYEKPVPEYPNSEDIKEAEIHANHLEAKNSSLRRTNSAFRRRTNTYAKSVSGLQRTLDVDFNVHNYLRPNFTTKVVPAVALGIIPRPYSIEKLLRMQKIS